MAGYILAARLAGMAEAERFWRSLVDARNADGTFYHVIGTDASRWDFDLRARAIDGTVWAIWADPEVDFNPFRTGPTSLRLQPQAPLSAEALKQRIESEERALEGLMRDLEAQKSLQTSIEDIEKLMETFLDSQR